MRTRNVVTVAVALFIQVLAIGACQSETGPSPDELEPSSEAIGGDGVGVPWPEPPPKPPPGPGQWPHGGSGLPWLGYPGSGLPGSGYPGSGLPGSGYPGSGYPGVGYPGSGYPGSGYPGSGYPGSGYPGSGYPGSGYPGQPPGLRSCGGIGGVPCPTELVCVDDPGDSCDPEAGGADCGGVCVPAQCDIAGRDYVARSPEQCAAVTFLCAAPLVAFFDECGCGCGPASGGEACGESVCGEYQFCCNPSCGICAPLGGACTQQICD